MAREIQVEITNRCPLNCIHCSSKELRMSNKKNTIVFDRLVDLLSRMPEEKCVFFTGGEPLNFKDLDNLCKQLNSLPNLKIGLFTCGILANDGNLSPINLGRAWELSEVGVEKCYLSLYGADANSHNRISNEISFDMTCKSIESLNKAGIQTNAHIVLTKQNIESIPKIIQLAEDLGMASVRILHLVKIGGAEDHWAEIGVDLPRQIETIKETFHRYKDTNRIRVTISGFPHIAPCRPTEDAVGCQRGSGILYITYDGSVYPCACAKGNNLQKLGSLHDISSVLSNLKAYEKAPCFNECLNDM